MVKETNDVELEQHGVCFRDDGRVDIDPNSQLSRTLSRLIDRPPCYESLFPDHVSNAAADSFPLRLNVVLQVVGSRGDVQPFIALGCALLKYGHRVRIGTHATFERFVRDSGLEFYPIGGNPEELMSYMVKNPGLIPSMKSVQEGDIQAKRKTIAAMLDGCWASCVEPDLISGAPFVADAIIANPVSFAHIHCAEALGVPLHVVFTMPWTPTGKFPHPLANIKYKAAGELNSHVNYLSYIIVGWMTFQGLGDVINRFRGTLGLEPVPTSEGPLLLQTQQVPHTYCWSPALVPRPTDWPGHIDVSGFLNREAPDYKPPEDLQAFLEAGTQPIYVGFGSIVVDSAERMSSTIVDAVTACGVRAIVSRGWSKLGGIDHPDIFWLGDCPHEWLFRQVSMVAHHGGAGTTACGLLNAKPTVVVPFFGDQPFWGAMIAAAGAGPEPIHHKSLTSANLADAIRFCYTSAAQVSAAKIAFRMSEEDGVQAALRSFHAHLPRDQMQCDVVPDQPAAWIAKVEGKTVRLSKQAADILIEGDKLERKNLTRHKSKPIFIENHRWDPATAVTSSLLSTSKGLVAATSGIFLEPQVVYRQHRAKKALKVLESEPRQNAFATAALDDSAAAAKDNIHQDLDQDSPATSDRAIFKHGQSAPVGSMIGSSALSVAKFSHVYFKGMLVDMPHAAAEGFRRMPEMWGEKSSDYGRVTDWKSGFVVAGKSFIQGIGDGSKDIVMRPAKGAQAEGFLGAAKGVAIGTGSLLTKTIGGSLGLVAYPGHGITKSLYSAFHGATRKKIDAACYAEGQWRTPNVSESEQLAVEARFREILDTK